MSLASTLSKNLGTLARLLLLTYYYIYIYKVWYLLLIDYTNFGVILRLIFFHLSPKLSHCDQAGSRDSLFLSHYIAVQGSVKHWMDYFFIIYIYYTYCMMVLQHTSLVLVLTILRYICVHTYSLIRICGEYTTKITYVIMWSLHTTTSEKV